MRILFVEDDPLLGDGIRADLQQQSFQVDWVRDDEAAWRELRMDAYVAAVLDLGPPRMDGIDVPRKVRGAGTAILILVLTTCDAISDHIRGLNLDADDYIVKPIDLHELSVRLHALIRRVHGHPTEQLRVCDIVLEPVSCTAFCNGRAVALSTREFNLLHILTLDAGRVLSYEQLEQCLYP